MFWKESHKSESFKLPKFLQQICQSNLGKDFNRVMSSRGVKSDKKENILKCYVLTWKKEADHLA